MPLSASAATTGFCATGLEYSRLEALCLNIHICTPSLDVELFRPLLQSFSHLECSPVLLVKLPLKTVAFHAVTQRHGLAYGTLPAALFSYSPETNPTFLRPVRSDSLLSKVFGTFPLPFSICNRFHFVPAAKLGRNPVKYDKGNRQ